MTSSCIQPSAIKLSICIPTRNRAAILAATLENILGQATQQCEVVISDNASTDDTEQVAARFAGRFERIRYIRQSMDIGFDRNTDSVVGFARGEYCWLIPDDDVLRQDAVSTVLEALCYDYSLVVVNAEIIDAHTSKVLWARRPDILADRICGPDELDGLFEVAGEQLTYLGAVVIKRAIWLERERSRYYGTLLAYHAVIFQKPLPGNALVMARPLILHKFGNQTWLANGVEMQSRMGALIESLAISETRKKSLISAGRSIYGTALLVYRAIGCYTLANYRSWVRPHLHSPWNKLWAVMIALLPGTLVYLFMVSYYSVAPGNQEFFLALLRNSPYRRKRRGSL